MASKTFAHSDRYLLNNQLLQLYQETIKDIYVSTFVALHRQNRKLKLEIFCNVSWVKWSES
jgi:hypothetical protein